MKIKIIIPTYNRCNDLKNCLDSIIAFNQKTEILIDVLVCDNMSTDHTKSLLEIYSKEYYFIEFYRREIFEKTGHASTLKLLEEIENTHDWYWIFGDDDILDIEDINQFKAVFELPKINYIHASTHYKIFHDQIIVDNITSIVKNLGILDLFGFISSQIISKNILDAIKQKISENPGAYDYDYCFVHTLVLFDCLKNYSGAITNSGWIRNIDDKPSEGSSEPFFHIAKFLSKASEKKIITLPEYKTFFLFEKRYIWRNFICWIISYCINTKTVPDEAYKPIIQAHINLCNDEELIRGDSLLLDLTFNMLHLAYSESLKKQDHNPALINEVIKIYNHLRLPYSLR